MKLPLLILVHQVHAVELHSSDSTLQCLGPSVHDSIHNGSSRRTHFVHLFEGHYLIVTPAADGSDVHYNLPQESLPGNDLHCSIFTVYS